MPVKKKRKAPGVAAAVAEDAGLKKCKISSYCRSQPPARLISGEEDFSRKKCLAWFYEYAGPDEVVGPEGMEKFCEDIGVEPENIIMLVLAWKLEAESMGFFTKEEWLKGMTSLQCDCTEKLQSRFDFLRSQLNDISSFKNIYRYAFDFARDKDQRSLDIDTAKSMLALLLGRTWPLFSVFYQYLEQSKYRVMNKDQWYNVLEFSRTVHADLSNYDEDGACFRGWNQVVACVELALQFGSPHSVTTLPFTALPARLFLYGLLKAREKRTQRFYVLRKTRQSYLRGHTFHTF